MTKDIVYVMGDDWEGVYIDGKLVNENHSVNWPYVLKQLGHYVSVKEVDYEWLGERGNFPEDISEVVFYD